MSIIDWFMLLTIFWCLKIGLDFIWYPLWASKFFRIFFCQSSVTNFWCRHFRSNRMIYRRAGICIKTMARTISPYKYNFFWFACHNFTGVGTRVTRMSETEREALVAQPSAPTEPSRTLYNGADFSPDMDNISDDDADRSGRVDGKFYSKYCMSTLFWNFGCDWVVASDNRIKPLKPFANNLVQTTCRSSSCTTNWSALL